MSYRTISMPKIRDILRLHAAQLSQPQIARSLNLSLGVVNKYIKLAQAASIGWPLPEDWDEATLRQRLIGQPPVPTPPLPTRLDFAQMHQELKRKGMTRQLLWEEYGQQCPQQTYSYNHFCLLYRQWRQCQSPVMRHVHKAGEKTFIDYAGSTIPIQDPTTGIIQQAVLFIAVLGASLYTYVEASESQALPHWIASHVRAFEYFGGVTTLLIPDNLRSAVKVACYYEPTINSTYADLAAHYSTAILPTRPYHPKDKAPVENSVLLVNRWILARLRHHTFFSLQDVNHAIKPLLTQLNHKTFKKMTGSRHSLFESLDQPALQPLPAQAYHYAEFREARVGLDYHVEIARHYYSAPYQLLRQKVQVRLTAQTVEIFSQQQRVASHVRASTVGGHSTQTAHMPHAHQRHREWTPAHFVAWAMTIGPATTALVESILQHKPHPEHSYRCCLGLRRLARRYLAPRLESACQRALAIGAPTYTSVASLLKTGRDQIPLAVDDLAVLPQAHDNVRGADYYH